MQLAGTDKKNTGELEKKAITYLKMAEEMYKKTGNDVERARVMRNFADISLDNGEFRKAREIYENALKLDKNKNRLGEAYDLAGIAESYLWEENIDEAHGFVGDAIKIYDELNLISDKCDLCLFVADRCQFCGRKDDAMDYMKEAEKGYKKIGDKESLARKYFTLGAFCLSCGDLKGAKKYADLAVKADPGVMAKMADDLKEMSMNVE